jgi:hypothetical protein
MIGSSSRIGLIAILVLAGCSSIPKAKVTYYQTKTTVNVKVIHSIACDKDTNPIIASSAITSVTHSADTEAEAGALDLEEISTIYSDDEFKFELTEDGRLKAINSSSNGQGEATVKAATALLPLLVTLKSEPKKEKPYKHECEFIKNVAGDKPLTITFGGPVKVDSVGSQDLAVLKTDKYYYDNLVRVIPNTCVGITNIHNPKTPITFEENLGYPKFKVRQPAIVDLAVGFSKLDICSNQLNVTSIPVAHLGKEYYIPIAKPAYFGKQTINATFSDSGSLTSLLYSDISGAASAANSSNSLITLLKGQTITQEIAQLKNEADLIAQQERLIACKASSKDCK